MIGDEPMLSGLVAVAEKITGDEPMLSGRHDLRRMGRMQTAFLSRLRELWADDEEISLLEAWKWVDEYTGNDYHKGAKSGKARRRREQAMQWTSAGLARLLHSFIRRGLIVVVKHEDGFSFIRARGIHDQAAVVGEER